MHREFFRTLFVVLSGIAFVFAFVLFGVLLRASFHKKAPSISSISANNNGLETSQSTQSVFKKEGSPDSPVLERALGAITESGLRGISGEKARLGLSISDYELTLPRELPALIGGEKVSQLVFEDSNFDYSKFLGKCVELGYVPVRSEDLKRKADLKSYSVYPVVVWEISILDRSKCSIYSGISSDVPLQTFEGKIARFERPAPDIGYDYKLELSEPYIDTQNASGLDQKVNFLILVPQSGVVWEQVEKTIGANVTVKGSFEWGYAETKYFLVDSVL